MLGVGEANYSFTNPSPKLPMASFLMSRLEIYLQYILQFYINKYKLHYINNRFHIALGTLNEGSVTTAVSIRRISLYAMTAAPNFPV